MTDANAEIQINGGVAPIIDAELAKLNASIRSTISNLQLLNSSNKTLASGTDTIGVALNNVSKNLKDTSHHLQQLTSQQLALSAGFRNNSKAISETARQIRVLEQANQSLNRNGAKFDTGPLVRYQKQLEAINASSKSITTANKAASFKQIGNGYEALSQKLNYASQRLTFGLSVPIAGFLRTGFNSLKSMSTQTIRLTKLLDDAYSSTVMVNKSQSELDYALQTIGKRLDDVSGKWGVSRELLQGVVGDFAEIGISSADALATLTQTTVEFEKLGNVDISQAGETIRNIYQNMARIRRDKGLGVTSSEDIAQMMKEVRGAVALFNYAENKTSLSLKNMAEAFPEVSAAATSFGLDMTTTAAMLAPMIGAGIKTGTAANSIKISLQSLVNVTGKAGKDLAALGKRLGVDLQIGGEIGAAGLQKLADAYTTLSTATGSNAAEKLKVFGEFFGKRQGTRFDLTIQQMSQFNKQLTVAGSSEDKLATALENTINKQMTLNGMKKVEIRNIEQINQLTKDAQERDSGGNFTARAMLIQKAQKTTIDNLTKETAQGKKLGDMLNGISTEYGKIQIAGAFGSALTGQTLRDELKRAEKSLEVQYGKAQVNIKAIARELTMVLSDILNILNPIIQKIAKAFQNMSSPVKKVIGLVLVMAAILGPMIRTFGAMLQLVGTFSKSLGKITELKSLGKSTVELNKDLLKTNDIVFRLGGTFEAFGKNGSVFTDKRNVKNLQKLSAIQAKEDSGQELSRSDRAAKKKALVKLAGRKAVREGTALSDTRDLSKVDLITENALNKVYAPQDQVKNIVDDIIKRTNESIVKAQNKGKKTPVTAESLGLKVKPKSQTATGRSTATTTTTATQTAAQTAIPVSVRPSTPTPISNVYESILKQILAVLKAIENCACGGKAAMTGGSVPPSSGPTASPRGPTAPSPAEVEAATSLSESSKLSDEDAIASKALIDAKKEYEDSLIAALDANDEAAKSALAVVDAKRDLAEQEKNNLAVEAKNAVVEATRPVARKVKRLVDTEEIRPVARKVKRLVGNLTMPTLGDIVNQNTEKLDNSKVNESGGFGKKKYGPAKPRGYRKPQTQKAVDNAVAEVANEITQAGAQAAAESAKKDEKPKTQKQGGKKPSKPKETKEKIFKPIEDFKAKIGDENMALLQRAGVTEAKATQGRAVIAFNLTKQHLINLFESLGIQVPEELNRIIEIADKRTGEAISIGPAVLAKIESSIKSGGMTALLKGGTGKTGKKTLDEALRGEVGTAVARTGGKVSYRNVRSGKDREDNDLVGQALATGSVEEAKPIAHYEKIFKKLKDAAIAAGRTDEELKNLDVLFEHFRASLLAIDKSHLGRMFDSINKDIKDNFFKSIAHLEKTDRVQYGIEVQNFKKTTAAKRREFIDESLKSGNRFGLIPRITQAPQLYSVMEDLAQGPKSRVLKYGMRNTAKERGLTISEKQAEETYGPIPDDLRIDTRIQRPLEEKLPKNRNYYKVKRSEYGLNNPLRQKAVESGASIEHELFTYGPLAGQVKKPLNKLSKGQYEKFANARAAMIARARAARDIAMGNDAYDEEPEEMSAADKRRKRASSSEGSPKGGGFKREDTVITDAEASKMLEARKEEIEEQYGKDSPLSARLIKKAEENIRGRAASSMRNIPGQRDKATKARDKILAKIYALQGQRDDLLSKTDEELAKDKIDRDASIAKIDNLLKVKEGELEEQVLALQELDDLEERDKKEKARLQRNARDRERRAEKRAAAAGGGAAGTTSMGFSMGGMQDPFAGLGPTTGRGPRMPQVGPRLAFVDKGEITGGVTRVYEEIRQALNIPVEIMDKVIAELAVKHNVITGVGNSLKTEISGDLNKVIEALRETLGGADMTVENVKEAFIAKRNAIGNLRGKAKASTTGGSSAPTASKEGSIGPLKLSDLKKDGDEAYAQMQQLSAHIKKFGIKESELNQLSLKQLQYLADAMRGGTERTKPVKEAARKLTDSKAKAIAIIESTVGVTVEKDAAEAAKEPTKPRATRKPKAEPAAEVPTPPPNATPVAPVAIPAEPTHPPHPITVPMATPIVPKRTIVEATTPAFTPAVVKAPSVDLRQILANRVAENKVEPSVSIPKPSVNLRQILATRLAGEPAEPVSAVPKPSVNLRQILADRIAENKVETSIAKQSVNLKQIIADRLAESKNAQRVYVEGNIAMQRAARQARGVPAVLSKRELAKARLEAASRGTAGIEPIVMPKKRKVFQELMEETSSGLRGLVKERISKFGGKVAGTYRSEIEQQKVPNKVLNFLNPLRNIEKVVTPKRIEYISRALSGKAPTTDLRETDIITGKAQARRYDWKAASTRGLMNIGKGLQKTSLAPLFDASLYGEAYMPTELSMMLGRGGKIKRPTTGMAGGARQAVFQRLGIKNPEQQSIGSGSRQGVANVLHAKNLPSAFETGSVSLLNSIKKLSPVFDTAIQVATKMAIEGSKLPYTVAKVYGKAVIEAHKFTGQAIAMAYNTFKGSTFAQNNPIGKTLFKLATTVENAGKATSNAIKATVNAIKNPAETLKLAKNAIEDVGLSVAHAVGKLTVRILAGKEVLDDAGNSTGKRKGGIFQPFRSVKEAVGKEGRARGMERIRGLGSSLTGGIRNAANQGISTLTMGLGPLGQLAEGPLQKLVSVALKFKSVMFGAVLPIMAVVGVVMLLKATFAAWGDKAGKTMANFKNVINIIKNVIDALKRAFFDFFASLFGPAKDSEGAMGNIGKKVESVSNVVARFANAFNRVFKKTILPAIYSFLSGLSLLIRGALKIFGGIIELVKGLVEKFTGHGDKAGKSFDKGWSMLKDGAHKAFKGIIKMLALPIKLIIDIFFKLVEWIVQLFEWMVIGVVNLIRYMVKAIINVSFMIVKGYVFIIDKVIELFVMLEKGAINIALAMVHGIVNTFFGIIKGAIFVVQQILNVFAGLIKGAGKIAQAFYDLWANALGALVDLLGKIPFIGKYFKQAGNFVTGMVESIGAGANKAATGVSDFLAGLMDPVTNGIQKGQNAILGFIDNVGGAALRNISKLNGLGDAILKELGNVQNGILDLVDGGFDKINAVIGSMSDGINIIRKGIVNWIDTVTQGDDITKGIGDKAKKAVKETLDTIADPQSAINAGKVFANNIATGLKNLKSNFYKEVTGSLGDSLTKLKDGMKEALGKQKEQQLKFFDDQIAGIDALAAAEEELTAKKKYEEDKRDRIAERALQKDAYRKNRALAIYEGRIEDARSLSLQEEKDNRDFNKDIKSMDEDRNNVLKGQNRDAAKAAIERQKKEASDQFDIQIKNFEDLIANIGKYGTLSKEDLQAQFDALNAQAVATSGNMQKAFEGFYTALPGIIQSNTDSTVGFFTAGIDTLITAAAKKYGAAQGVSDPTTLLGLTNQMLANTGSAYTAGFSTTIVPAYNDGQDEIANIAKDFADPSKPNSLSGIYATAIKNATDAVTAEFMNMKVEASKAFADVVAGINDELRNLAITQAITDAKAELANGATANTGGTATGTPSQSSGATGGTQSVGTRFGPANIATAAFSKLLGPDGLFKDGDSNAYIKKAKEALAFYGYSGFSTTSEDMGPKTIAALKSFQAKYNIAGNHDGNLGISAANALGLFKSAGVQKKFYGGMIKKAMGGAVPGFGNQGVPALLHGGEYVISSKAVQNLGLGLLAQINGLKHGVPSFNVPKSQISGMSGVNVNSTTHSSSETTHNYNFYVDNFIGEDQWFESMMKDYNVKVVPNSQKAAGLESRVIRTYNGLNRGM